MLARINSKIFLMLSLIVYLNVPGPGLTEGYKIGLEDLIRITFWQQPELNTTARVTQDGKINLPVIGEVQAGGLTTEELSKTILEKISFYNRSISQATVTVIEYNSQKIFIRVRWSILVSIPLSFSRTYGT